MVGISPDLLWAHLVLMFSSEKVNLDLILNIMDIIVHHLFLAADKEGGIGGTTSKKKKTARPS